MLFGADLTLPLKAIMFLASEASSYIEGDVAYYSSAQDQYTVVRNVYVKAAAVGGDVDRDASGRAKIYGDGAIPAKGVVVDTTSDAMTEANGYHAATIVIDRLTDAAGGEGVDVLIGIEGLAFGATDNFYLQDFSHPRWGSSGWTNSVFPRDICLRSDDLS